MMSEKIPISLKPIVDRWNTFEGKVSDRLREVLIEADAGFDEVMHTEIVDSAAMSGAVSAVEARMRGLRDKVSQGWEKIEQEIDRVIHDTEDSHECQVLYRTRTEIRKRSAAFMEKIQDEFDRLRIHKEAKAARMLGEVARKEMQSGHPCHQCKAELKSPTPHKATTMKCPYCQAVNSLLPGMATAMYFDGGAMHQLSQEGALAEWIAVRKEEKTYQSFRQSIDEDFFRFENANKAYWQKYYEVQRSLHPDWTEQLVGDQVRAKMGQFQKLTGDLDRNQREIRTKLLDLAQKGDRSGVIHFIKQHFQDAGSFAESMGECAFEHQDTQKAKYFLDIAYELQSSDEDKDAFVEEKLADMERYITK